ncbi:hypothetical protein [Pseudomonas sp. TCU-HL1]|uniref:hypothetical protein n=1 Tax=Pseudomonas sp. TCU-HL1 TaxID=1856685 RepID=UPI0011AB8AE0|nr:hypothetical protein [Pseudomonas sp. TCU-HL1]
MMIYEASGKPGDGMKLDTSVKWDVVHQGIYCLTITALTACTRDEALPMAIQALGLDADETDGVEVWEADQ